jgi:mannose-1-phosphate guanylyltransferase
MQSVGAILAAGLGTRLRPLTDLRPKPLVPVAGVPLVEFALEALSRAGVRRIGINAFHLGEQLPEALAHRAEQLSFVHEETLQGTGGGLRGIAAGLPRATLVAVNGDALFTFDLAPILAAHRDSGAMATLALREVPPDAPFGRVGVDPDGRVRRIAEVEGPGADLAVRFGAFTGVQILEPEMLDAVPPTGEHDIFRSAYRARLAQGAHVHGVFVDPRSPWLDVGTVDRYLEANRAVLTGAVAAPWYLPPADEAGRRVHPVARVAASARLEGPLLIGANAVVAEGARVGPGTVVDHDAVVMEDADLEGCVVWPAARARGTLRGVVVLPEGQSPS